MAVGIKGIRLKMIQDITSISYVKDYQMCLWFFVSNVILSLSMKLDDFIFNTLKCKQTDQFSVDTRTSNWASQEVSL